MLQKMTKNKYDKNHESVMLQRAVTTSPVLLAVKVPRPWQGPCIRTWRLRCGWCTGQDNGSRAARGERHAARGHRRRWCVPCISQHGLPHVRLPHFLLPVCTVPRHLTFVFVCGTRSGARSPLLARACARCLFSSVTEKGLAVAGLLQTLQPTCRGAAIIWTAGKGLCEMSLPPPRAAPSEWRRQRTQTS